jgi:acyl-CoA synthetase (AMP-forming)/AMP-acid ligase II
VPKPGAAIEEAALLAALRDHLDPYKIPKAVIVVDAMPRTSTGKIQKNRLRDEHTHHYS